MKDPPLRLAALLLALALPALGSQESPPLQQDLVDGAAALAKNDLPAAELAFREVLSQSEDVPQAWLGLSEVERRRANLEGALASARRAQEVAPEMGATAFAVGRTLAEMGAHKEAIASLSEARRVAPDEVDAYVLEAFLLRESEQESDALAVLTEAWDRGLRSEPLAEQLSLLHLSAGRAPAALKIAEDALREQPHSVALRFAKGLALVAIPERRSEAALLLEEVLAAGPKQGGRVRLELGGLLLEEGRPAAALPHFEAAALQMPDLLRAFYGLSAALRGVGDEVGARRAMERFEVLSKEADDADREGKQLGIDLNEAQLLAGQNRLPAARARIEEILRDHPDDARALALRAKILFSMGKKSEARVSIARARELQPGVAEYSYLHGLFLLSSGDSAGAARALGAALAVDPMLPSAHRLLAGAFAKLGKTAAAIDHFQRALELGLDEPGLRLGYASALEQLGREEEAARQMEAYERLSARN